MRGPRCGARYRGRAGPACSQGRTLPAQRRQFRLAHQIRPRWRYPDRIRGRGPARAWPLARDFLLRIRRPARTETRGESRRRVEKAAWNRVACWPKLQGLRKADPAEEVLKAGIIAQGVKDGMHL